MGVGLDVPQGLVGLIVKKGEGDVETAIHNRGDDLSLGFGVGKEGGVGVDFQQVGDQGVADQEVTAHQFVSTFLLH